MLLDFSDSAAVCKKRVVPSARGARLGRGRPFQKSHWNVRRRCNEARNS
jgi:hypothetical protein